jgi:8-oxo-dGTP pyrophosphatase MutT (NUDIX family)
MLREAAAMVLARDTKEGIEVCMLRRVDHSRFAAGAYVFPGGAVDEQDSQFNSSSLQSVKAPVDEPITAYKIAAIRETFEESGLLIATVNGEDKIDHELREQLQRNELAFEQVLNLSNATLKLDAVIFYDHWITPEAAPIRFDTRFFLSTVSSEQKLIHDDKETDQSCWARPSEVLSLHEKGEVKLMPVTHVQLKRLSKFESVAELLTSAKKQTDIQPTLPVLNYDASGKPESVSIQLVEGLVKYPPFRK